MLMLQQKVRILAEPYLGEEQFDDDRIGQVTNIMSLILRDDDVLYQLEGHYSECLWREDELGAGDCMLAIEPRFNLGDEVLIRRIGEPDILQTVGAIYGTENDFRYLFEEGGWDAKIHDVGEPEKNLTLSRRKLEYTLF